VHHDIAADDRREDISALLSGYGPRVQYSDFEAALPSKTAATRLRRTLQSLIDPDEDQIRLYPLSATQRRHHPRQPPPRRARGLLDRLTRYP
jgi:CRISPR-associated protein Cas2